MMIPFKYLFSKYKINPKGILHCGASIGQEGKEYADLKVPKVIWIEAIPEVYHELKINVIDLLNENICINACIGEVDGKEVDFNVSNNEAQSSSYLKLGVHKEIHPEVFYTHTLELETRRIDTLNKELNLKIEETIDFVNMDLQGVELQALKSMGNLLKNIKWCYLEINKKETYIGGALVWEIDEFLFKHGFDRVETGVFVADTWTDALYIQKNVAR